MPLYESRRPLKSDLAVFGGEIRNKLKKVELFLKKGLTIYHML